MSALMLLGILGATGAAQEVYDPVTLSGFNDDLIANGSNVTSAATTSTRFDRDGTGNVFYSRGFRSALTGPSPYGLPESGALVSESNPNIRYQLAPYDGYNALLLRNGWDNTAGGATSGTLFLTEPGYFSELAILGTSSEGDSVFNCTFNFSDGSTFTTMFIFPDWFGHMGGVISGFGRIYRYSDTYNNSGVPADPTLYEFLISFSLQRQKRLLTSITFTWVDTGSWARGAILGVSGVRQAPSLPVANLTAPTNGARFLPGTNILLAATATVSNGTIARVDFFDGDRLLGRSTHAPYNLMLSNAAPGTYVLTARAYDEAGIMAMSAPVNFVVAAEASPLVFYPDFAQFAGLSLQGQATGTLDRLRLTTAGTNSVSAAWLTARQQVQGGFQTTFTFEISEVRGGGADGLAFVVQNSGVSALGLGGGGLGYEGIANSLAIELDFWQHPEEADVDDSHVSIHSNGPEPNSAFESLALDCSGRITDLSDRTRHVVTIRYVPGKLQVWLDNATGPVLSLPLRLEEYLELDQGQAFVGFTASTSSNASQTQDILMWSFWPDLPPVVSLSRPLDNERFLAPTAIALTADANDGDGRFVCVDFYANDFYLGSALGQPYELTWSNVPPGSYQLKAQAIDEFGVGIDSSPVHISVEGTPRLEALRPQPGQPWQLEFSTIAGRSYSLQYSSDLVNWDTTPSFTGVGGLQRWTDPESPISGPGAKRFYRLIIWP